MLLLAAALAAAFAFHLLEELVQLDVLLRRSGCGASGTASCVRVLLRSARAASTLDDKVLELALADSRFVNQLRQFVFELVEARAAGRAARACAA